MIFFQAFYFSLGFQSSLSFWLSKSVEKKEEENINYTYILKNLYAGAVTRNGNIFLLPKYKGKFFPLFRYLAWIFLRGKNFIPIEITGEKKNIIKDQNLIISELLKISDKKNLKEIVSKFFAHPVDNTLLNDFIKESDLEDGLHDLLVCKNFEEIKKYLPFLTSKIDYICYKKKIMTFFTENIYITLNNNMGQIKGSSKIGDLLGKDGVYTMEKINYFAKCNKKTENKKNIFHERYDCLLPVSGEFKTIEAENINKNMKKSEAEEKDFKFSSLEDVKEASNLLIFYYLLEEQMKNSDSILNLEQIDTLLQREKININSSQKSFEKIGILLYGYKKEEDKRKVNIENVKKNFNIENIKSFYEEFLSQDFGISFMFQVSNAGFIKKVGNFLMKKDFICFRIICNLNVFSIIYNYYLNSVVSPMKVLDTFFSISGEKFGIGFFVDFETIFYFLMKFLSEKNAKESVLKYIKSIFSIFQIALSISFLDEKMLLLFYYEISSRRFVFNIIFYPFSTKMRQLSENNKVNYDESSVPSFVY